ncbi:MAG: DUF3806 domain-containing protein [Myxococcota bacterium]|nr:DUF3806 domain-containing protein [Myxococcota bacterium]
MKPLDTEEREELDWLLEEGAGLLASWDRFPEDPSDPEAIEASIRAGLADNPVPDEQVDDAAFALGALLGDALCAAEGMEWVSLEDGHAIAPTKSKDSRPPRRIFEEVRQWIRG